MSFGTASVDVELDARRAVSQLQGLLQTIASSKATVTLSVNVSNVAPQVEGAIDAADSQIEVTADAREVTGAIDGSVDAADSQVEVTGDATQVTGVINGSVDAADTQVTVTGDATDVTGSIDGAVDAADSSVIITADAADVTGSINGAVGAADKHVRLDVDDGGTIGGVADALDDVNLSLIAASGSGLRLRAIFKGLSAAGVAVGLFQAAQAASDLAESTSKATVVFGQGIDEVKAFASTSATSIGLSQQAALEATGTFGNLFFAMGSTREAATQLAPQVVTLAADLASFNNLALDETLEKLRSGLVGEIEPLRSLGISFNAAQVEAKAMELGLADANGTVSEGAKLQARWALILEQSTTAQGDFARTSSGLANQQRILTAEFQNAVASLGQQLLPALLEGVSIARSDLIPAFQQAGEEVLPALADAFIALLPLAGGFANLLVALAPAISAVAGAVAGVPPELITLIGLLVTFRRIGGTGLFKGLVDGFRNLAVAPGAFTSGLKTSISSMIAANAASIGLSLGLAAIGLAFEEEARKAAEFDRIVKTIQSTLTQATQSGDTVEEALSGVFERLVEEGGSFASVLQELGLSADEFADIAARGGDISQRLIDAVGQGAEKIPLLGDGFEQLERQVQAAAEAEVDMIRAQGDLSDETIAAAEAAHTQQVQTAAGTITTTDYVRVLQDLNRAQLQAAEAIGVTTDETGALVQATGPAAQAANELALGLELVRSRGGNTKLELTNLAVAAGNARIAEEDLQNVADALGVSLDDLQTFVSSVNDAVNQFADDTLATLPSVGDIIGELGDDFSPQALLDKLTEATEGIANFSQNLEDLAAFPRVQQIAATNGPLVAAALAKPVQDGNTQVLSDLEAQAAAFNLHYAGLDTELRTTLGPQLAAATGLTGTLATQAFGATFNPAADATVAVHGTIAAIEAEDANMRSAGETVGAAGTDGFSQGLGGMPVSAGGITDETVATVIGKRLAGLLAGSALGGDTTRGFSQGLGGMPEEAGSAADSSLTAVTGRTSGARHSGVILGSGFSQGTGTGAAGMVGAAASATDAAIGTVSARAGAGSSAGYSVGFAIGTGMQSGINAVGAQVGAAAAAMVQQAIAAARAAAQTGSPSKLFAALGEDMGEGVVVGLASTADTVAKASAEIVSAAAATAEQQAALARQQLQLRPLAVDSDVESSIRSAVAATTGGTVITFARGAFEITFTNVPDRTEAQVVGDTIGNAVADTLNRRLARVAARIA